MSWRCDSGSKSSITCPPHGSTGANPGKTRWLRLGLFQSICPTIKYQPGKANVVADALSQSQQNEVEDSMDDPEATAVAVEEQVLALSGFSVELIAEDLQAWTKANKEDKSHMTAYTKLCQGQKYQDIYLTPSGLLARMVGGQQKIIVPRSLQQHILKNATMCPSQAMWACARLWNL